MPRKAEIRKIERKDGRPKRWGISFPLPGKTPRRVFFERRAERDAEFVRASRIASMQGVEAVSMTAAQVQLLRELDEILLGRVDPREAARFWVKMHTAESIALCDASKEYLLSLQRRKLSRDYQSQVHRATGRLMTYLGDQMAVADITPRQMEQFIFSFPFALRSLANYHTYFRSFFTWCEKRGYCRTNPMAALQGVDVPDGAAHVMPVDDVGRLFAQLVEDRAFAAPFLALAFFAGFRSSMIPRLVLPDFSFEERGITLPSTATKTKKRFYVEGHPDCLWAWLEPLKLLSAYPKFANSTFRDWREKAYLKGGVEYPENGARDSFCSYDMAMHRDASRTATLLTHRGTSMLRQKYLGKATKTDGLKYFAILPPENYLELFRASMLKSKHRMLLK